MEYIVNWNRSAMTQESLTNAVRVSPAHAASSLALGRCASADDREFSPGALRFPSPG